MSHPPPASVIVHPLVLLSVVDHWRRVARDTRKRVVGVLLGERLGSGATARVDITTSFAGEEERGGGGARRGEGGRLGRPIAWAVRPCAGPRGRADGPPVVGRATRRLRAVEGKGGGAPESARGGAGFWSPRASKKKKHTLAPPHRLPPRPPPPFPLTGPLSIPPALSPFPVTVPFEEDERDPAVWFFDHSYAESMLAMFRKVNGELEREREKERDSG